MVCVNSKDSDQIAQMYMLVWHELAEYALSTSFMSPGSNT